MQRSIPAALLAAVMAISPVASTSAQANNNEIRISRPFSAYDYAAMWIGKDEIADRQELMGLFKKTIGRAVDPRQTPWCAGFVDAMLRNAGFPIHDTLWARDFLNYGTAVSQPKVGNIVVLKRGRVNGHVGFFHSYFKDRNGRTWVGVLGGNTTTRGSEGNVSIGYFPFDYVLGFRRIG